MIGETISHYRIVEKIGQGGMGEVYLADDTTLDRKVALKFLPEAFTSDPERMARFEREAKLLASLNHPNIAGIYGLEHADENRFLVLEYVEGETLQAKLSKGSLPLEDALALCRQIAEGLEAAHEKGVIHRDLKPANVMITAEEKVKILDFGLAKALADETQRVDLSDSPTITEEMTRPGVVLGTAAYMSPEQAKGKAVDKRADIWAFGCILYECLTGKRVFEGETATETLAAIMKGEPDWNRLPPNTHPRIKFMLERCLEKDSKNRYSGISDARVDIQEVQADPGGVFAQPVVAATPKKGLRLGLPWIAAVFILGLIVAGVGVWYLKPSEPRPVVRFDYQVPWGQQLAGLTLPVLAISPDGSEFVYCTPEGLYLRPISELEAKLITGTEESPITPFFSPDGKWIGYYSLREHKLKKVSIVGGVPVELCDVAEVPIGASWGADDQIVYSQTGKGIMQVSANGGIPKLLVKKGEGFIWAPQILPDGKTVLYSFGATTPGAKRKIMVQRLEWENPKPLFTGISAQYLPTGHILYAVENDLFTVPFDPDSLEVTGDPVPVPEGVFRSLSIPQYSVSDSGTLIYIPMTSYGSSANITFVWVDRNGKEEPLPAQPNNYRGPRISPDGTRLVFTVNPGENPDVWIWDIARENMMRLTFDANATAPIWSPDGKRIIFASLREDKTGHDVFQKAADGTGETERLGSAKDLGIWPGCWSNDGKTLVTMESQGIGRIDIGSLSMEGNRARELLLHEEKYLEAQPQISSNGQWMAYVSNESGNYEVYVRPFPDVNSGKWQVSKNGGENPLWSPDGRELFYRYGDKIMAVPVQADQVFKPGNPDILFRGTYLDFPYIEGYPWDISPDGKRFLMMKRTGPADLTSEAQGGKINIVLNWFEELKQKVPVD